MSAVVERGHRHGRTHEDADSPAFPGSQPHSATQISTAPGDSFSLRTYTREFLEDRDTTDMAAVAELWAQSIPFDALRIALAQVSRDYLRSYIASRRRDSVRVGSPKWQQSDDGHAARLEGYLLVSPEGGFACVLDCSPDVIRFNAAMRRDQAAALIQEAERLDELAEATEKGRKRTPRALNPEKVFSILVRGADDE